MIISSLVLLLGFLTRVVRSHKTLSIHIILRLRTFPSELFRRGLLSIYGWFRIQASPRSLTSYFIYHPLLCAFLLLRLSLDVYSSMLMEVDFII